MCVLVSQSRLTLCNSMDCSQPGSSVHGIFQARILEWGAIAFSNCSRDEAFFFFNSSSLTCWGFSSTDVRDNLELFNYLDVYVKISNYFILRAHIF